eukprot:TRINITY_DN10486_c0_g1_i2.p1 TRINITY_DN10486_c0_g1~~TRINITY_DN10486_c0_g1_i2.p1  ORF type:complete len:314 (+),score=53.57 TRINITY_DN10486_c0_g1_i2:75-1016(+)
MQAVRRRPLGDIGNTLGNHAPALKEKPRSERARSSSLAGLASPKVDEKNRLNPLHATDCLKEIHEYFRKTEARTRPAPTYIARLQTDINEKMRTMLIDWLVDVHLKFKLSPETLFLGADIVDRFLDKKVVNRQKLQLVGVVGMLLAAKYEEIYPPEIKDFVYIAANTYTREDILRMERLMFQTLDFNLTFPTIYVFLKRYLQVVDADTKSSQLAQFLAELCLLDYKMLTHTPSMMAASCIYLTNLYLGVADPWNHILEHYSQYKVGDLERCSKDIISIVLAAPTQKTQAVRKKYSYAKYGEVSKLSTLEIPVL